MLPDEQDEQIAALEQRRAHLLGQIASVGQMRAGSLTVRFRRCGTAGCHCAQPGDPGHGPVLSLTRQQDGKTVTRIIPAPAEAETRARGTSAFPGVVEGVGGGQHGAVRSPAGGWLRADRRGGEKGGFK